MRAVELLHLDSCSLVTLAVMNLQRVKLRPFGASLKADGYSFNKVTTLKFCSITTAAGFFVFFFFFWSFL